MNINSEILSNNLIIVSLILVYGLVIGSFLNVCIYRMPKGESIISGRSHCTTCDTKIKAIDLIPVVSYIALRGKCRDCGARISPVYLIVELITALFFLALYFKYGLSYYTLLLCVVFAVMIIIAYIDFYHMIIPDRLIVLLFAVGIIMILTESNLNFYERAIGMFIISAPMLIVAWITGGFGGGDIKLFAAIGVIFGYQLTLFIAFVAIMLGGVFALFLMIFKKKDKKAAFCFGPFIVIGTFIGVMCGTELIYWYIY